MCYEICLALGKLLCIAFCLSSARLPTREINLNNSMEQRQINYSRLSNKTIPSCVSTNPQSRTHSKFNLEDRRGLSSKKYVDQSLTSFMQISRRPAGNCHCKIPNRHYLAKLEEICLVEYLLLSSNASGKRSLNFAGPNSLICLDRLHH